MTERLTHNAALRGPLLLGPGEQPQGRLHIVRRPDVLHPVLDLNERLPGAQAPLELEDMFGNGHPVLLLLGLAR
jgi:hypothetical protein